MKNNNLICYYSDNYDYNKKCITLNVIIVNKGMVYLKKSKTIKNVTTFSSANYIIINEIFSLIIGLEERLFLKYRKKYLINIVTFNENAIKIFTNSNFLKDKMANNIAYLRKTFKHHKNWNIRYDIKSKNIFEKLWNRKNIRKQSFIKRRKVVRKVEQAQGYEKRTLIFFDLEMNCVDKKDNTLGYWEIISLGAVKYNPNNNSLDKFYVVLKPKIQKKLSDRCKEITGLTQEEVDNGIGFKECIDLLEKWIGNEKFLFISWGREDIKALKCNSLIRGNKNQFINRVRKNYVDFQKEFSYYYKKMNQVISLSSALNCCSLEFEGKKHNALSDAYNLYRVYRSYTRS